MTVGRVSQTASEVLLQVAPKARVDQQSVELFQQGAPRTRFGQQAVEVLRSVALVGGATGRQPVLILCTCG
ncbi:MAG: hypothetical protein AB7I59_02250 [Geminicoccaceae bacterium]